MNAETLLIALGLLWFLSSRPSGFSLTPPVVTPGTQVNIPGTGISLILPTGAQTYHVAGGRTVTVMPGAATAPGGWVEGMLDDNSWVWFYPPSGAVQLIAPGQNI